MSDIALIQFDPTTGIATVGMGNVPQLLSGSALLTQIVVLEFMKNPGRSVIQPSEGAGIRAAIGQFNMTSATEVKLFITQRSQNVEKTLLARQKPGVGLPSERLQALTILDVATDLTQGQVMARIRITSETGATTDVLV
jgi:hypothetical protein